MGRVATNLPYKSILYLLSGKYAKIFYFQIYSTAFSVRAKKNSERLAMMTNEEMAEFQG